MKNKIIAYFSLLCALMLSASCKDDPYVENPSGEVFIYRLNVTNAGLSGAESYTGVVDEESKTVSFTIPAESDVQALKFEGKLSLGASLDQETYDASSGTVQVVVVNGENRGAYTINVALTEPTETPVLSKVRVKGSDGVEKNAYISELDKTVYLNCEGMASVEVVEITTLPKRSTVTLTTAVNSTITAESPGKIKLDFMGLTSEYRFSFEGEPVFGADFTKGLKFDYTNNTTIYSDFSAENTRSADFDGETMLIVSREGGIYPKVLKYDDIKAGQPNEKILDTSVISGGTYVISAGRLSHGHIYICNLTTAVGSGTDALKVYHWADENATSEVVVEFDGEATNTTVAGARFGDNISVNLDEDGNGYIFFVTQDGTQMLRFDVAGFTSITNPTQITPSTTAPYYAAINQVYGSDNEYVYTSTQAAIMLIDKDGKELFKMPDGEHPLVQATDARIIVYDAERYLIVTTGRRGSWSGDPVQTFYVYDISEGANTLIALTNFAAGSRLPLFSYSLEGGNCSAPAANTGWGIGEDGNLRIMSAATKSGFVVFEFPEKQ